MWQSWSLVPRFETWRKLWAIAAWSEADLTKSIWLVSGSLFAHEPWTWVQYLIILNIVLYASSLRWGCKVDFFLVYKVIARKGTVKKAQVYGPLVWEQDKEGWRRSWMENSTFHGEVMVFLFCEDENENWSTFVVQASWFRKFDYLGRTPHCTHFQTYQNAVPVLVLVFVLYEGVQCNCTYFPPSKYCFTFFF